MVNWTFLLLSTLVLSLLNEVWVYTLLHDKGHESGLYEYRNLKRLLQEAKNNSDLSFQYYTAFSFKLLVYGSIILCSAMLLLSGQ